MALLSPMLLFVLLLMSAAETQRKETNVERTIPAKNDVVGTGPTKNDVVGAGPTKNDVVGAGPTKNDAFGAGPAKNDVVGAGPAKNDVVGARPAKNDVVGSGPAKNDVVGTRQAKNDVDGTRPAKNDVDGTGPVKYGDVGKEPANRKNDVVRTRAAKNDVRAFSAELSEGQELYPEGIIKFDTVLANVGNLYYPTSGQFGCVDDALYVFVWNLMKPDNPSSYGYVRCISALHRGGIDRKYGPKTSIYRYDYTSGVSEMMAIQECNSSTPTAATITVQPWTTQPGSLSTFYPRTTSFSGFKLTSTIGFTAELSQHLNVGDRGRVVFDKVLANHGNHYNDIHSYFLCPDAGVYVFGISIQNHHSSQWSAARLMMDKEVVMQGPITYQARSSYDSGSASGTTVLQCTPGQSVYVEGQSAYTYPSNWYGANLTSFTGFKLYDVTTETIAFTAVMSQNFSSTSSSVFEPVPFDEVITNIGNAFNTSAGHFVCPDDAYYLFTWTAVSNYGYAYMHLYMDDSLVKELHTSYQTSSASSGTSGSCTQSVILQCQPGSVFQLRGQNDGGPFLGGYTSFSGYKIPG